MGSALALPTVVRTLTLAFAIALFGCSGADADFVVADAVTEDTLVAETTADTSVPDDSMATDTFVEDSGVDSTVAEDAPPDVTEDSKEVSDSADSTDDAAGDGASDTTDAPAEAADDALSDAVTQLDAILLDVAVDAVLPDVSLPCDVTVKCWVDKDGDGYAVASAPIIACACPPGTASRDPAITIDCNDENPLVHPGALTFHDSPYCVGAGCATQSFDYDCSGAEEPIHASAFAGCGTKAAGCPGTGWTGAVPTCGSNGTFVTCKASLLTCDMSSAMTTQLCR